MRGLNAIRTSLLSALLASVPGAAWGRIKLITLPIRERVEIQLDHPDATLVEEERIVPLVQGVNQVDFSWANTQIDPNTIVFRVVAPAGQQALEAKVLSVSYPPRESALVWSVSSSASGSARVRISYLLGGLTKSFAYRAIASKDEATLSLSQFIRLQNFANEEFGSTELWAGFGKEFQKPVGINQTMEMLMARFDDVPIRKTYSCDPDQFGYLDPAQQQLRVPMHYVLSNTKASNLGTAALPYGKVRIFIKGDQEDSSAFLGEDWGHFTAIDDEMKLYLGVAQDVAVRRTIDRTRNIPVAGNLYDREVVLKYEVENFKETPVTLDVSETLAFIRRELGMATDRDTQYLIGPETTFVGGIDAERSAFDRLVLHAPLPARAKDGKAEKIVLKLHLILKNEW